MHNLSDCSQWRRRNSSWAVNDAAIRAILHTRWATRIRNCGEEEDPDHRFEDEKLDPHHCKDEFGSASFCRWLSGLHHSQGFGVVPYCYFSSWAEHFFPEIQAFVVDADPQAGYRYCSDPDPWIRMLLTLAATILKIILTKKIFINSSNENNWKVYS